MTAYAIVRGEVRYRDWLVDRADAASFVPLPWGWARDRAHVYSHGCRVDGADPETFVPLDEIYGRDRVRVFGGRTALDCDAATFRRFGDGYGVDARYAYYGELRLGWLTACWTLETVDPRAFATRALGWAVDGSSVYRRGVVVPDADPSSLIAMTTTFARDRARVFADARVIDAAQLETFRPLSEHYALDARHVYWASINWRVVNSPYHGGPGVPDSVVVDRATFQPLGTEFARDANHFYWHNDVVVDVPAASRVLSTRFACSADRVH